jgi:hypothetical protein
VERKQVKSSYVRSIGYDRGTLELEYKNGAIFQYKKVPEKIYGALMEAESLGRFIRFYIQPDYEYERIQ